MFYLIKQLSIQKALKVRSIFIASTAAVESVYLGVKVNSMLHQYRIRLDLYNLNVSDFFTNVSDIFKVMSSEDRALLEKALPLCQKIYDSYKETVLPTLYKDSIEFNCVSSWNVYVKLRQAFSGMLDGKAVAINRPTFSLCSDLSHDDTALMLVYKSKGCTKRISFVLNIAEKRFDAQSYPAELDTTEDGRVVIPGKTILADVCKMLQMPIWSSNEYVATNNRDNRPFYMTHDLLTKNLPDNVFDLPILRWSGTFTFANLLQLMHTMYNWQVNSNRR